MTLKALEREAKISLLIVYKWLKKRLHWVLTAFYFALTLIFAFATLATYGLAFSAPIESPPKQPIIIGAGNAINATVDRTSVVFNIPYQEVNIEVTLNVSQPDTFYLYALLPFTAYNVTPYAIRNSIRYPLSTYYPDHPDYLDEIGTFDSHFLNTPDGLAVINASIQPTVPFFPDNQITVGAHIEINDTMLAIYDPQAGRESVIYTFFGGNINWTEEMAAFRTPISQQTLWRPFVVQIALPYSYYFSSSQPAPIEYFVNNSSRWIMFSMDFLNGQYAQTLVCNFENPSGQSHRELNIFLVGVFFTLFITFLLETIKEVVSALVKSS
jgi:hypothetical protein